MFHSIFTEERLERLTKQINSLSFESPENYGFVVNSEDTNGGSLEDGSINVQNGAVEALQSSDSISGAVTDDISQIEHQNLSDKIYSKKEDKGNVVPVGPEMEELASCEESVIDTSICDNITHNQSVDRHLHSVVLSPLRYQQFESSESSSRYIILTSSLLACIVPTFLPD